MSRIGRPCETRETNIVGAEPPATNDAPQKAGWGTHYLSHTVETSVDLNGVELQASWQALINIARHLFARGIHRLDAHLSKGESGY